MLVISIKNFKPDIQEKTRGGVLSMQEKFVLRTLKKVAAIGTGAVLLGATLTGALALDLKDYPSPFVKSGVYDSANAFVAGDKAAAADTLGMVDIAANLQFLSKSTVSTAGGVSSITGGVKKEIPMDTLLNHATYGWSTALKDDDVSALQDTTLDIDMNDVSDSYNVEDTLTFSTGLAVETAVTATSPNEDYENNVFLEVGSDSIQYRYVFKEALTSGNFLVNASSSNPIDLIFMGKNLKIQGAGVAGDTITATVGEELFMKVGDVSTVNKKKVKLVNVASGTGSNAALVVDIDGVQKTVSGTSSVLVNGLKVRIQDVFYTDTLSERSATLIVGTDAVKTYTNGDPYIGEDKNDPDWVWAIENAHTGSPTLGVDFDQSWDGASNVVKVGKSVSLPNDFVTLKLDSLTQTKKQTYTVETNVLETLYNKTGGSAMSATDPTPISGSDSAAAKFRVTRISADGGNKDGFKLGTVGESDKIVFAQNYTSGNESTVGIYYWDTSNNPNKYRHYATISANASASVIDSDGDAVLWPQIQFDDALANITAINGFIGKYNLTIPAMGTEIYDAVILQVKSDSSETKLGSGTTIQDGDLFVAGVDRGSWDKDIRTQDGLVIKKPKSNIEADKFVFEVPGDLGLEFRALVTVTGKTSKVVAGSTTYKPVAITPVTKLASEVSDPTAYNLVVVGGPCANKLAETVFGLSCGKWSLKTGEAMVKLAANGKKVAMLVAGTTATDTRRAAKALANSGSYTWSGAEALVKGTTMTDIKVEKPAAKAAAKKA